MPLNITETKLKGLFIIEVKAFSDDRGCFFESFNCRNFRDAGITADFIQDNISRSKKGVLRGLHYQLKPMSQTKLLSVLSGRILDVAVDIRKGSQTFGDHFSLELSSENKKLIYIPSGFAHGFVALEENTVVLYKCDNYYSPAHERGIKYNDPALKINWVLPETELTVAKRDMNFPVMSEVEMNFIYGE